MNSCDTCPMVQSDDYDVNVFSTSLWQVVLDPNQEYLGKCFITLREHKEKLSDLDTDDWLQLHEVIQKLEPAITTAFSPTHFNWSCLMNDAIGRGLPTHVHWHCQPRYKDPVVFAGETFTDSRWPLSARPVNEHLVSKEILTQISEGITKHIQ